MKTNGLEQKFLDHLEGRLSEGEAQEFSAALENDAELCEAYRAYQRVVTIERRIAGEQHQAGAHFAVKVLERIEEEEVGFMRRLSMAWKRTNRRLVSSFALVATVVLVFLLTKDIQESDYALKNHPSLKAYKHPKSYLWREQAKKHAARGGVSSSVDKEQPAEEAAGDLIQAFKNDVDVSKQNKAELNDPLERNPKESARPKSVVQSGQTVDHARHLDSPESISSGDERREGKRDRLFVPEKESDASKRTLEKAKEALNSAPEPAAGGDPRVRINPEAPAPFVSLAIEGSAVQASPRERQGRGREAVTLADRRRAQDESLPPQTEARKKAGSADRISNQKPAKALAGAVVAEREEASIVLPPPPSRPAPIPQQPLPRDDADNYKGYEEQPRIRTLDEALSTFSVDVDTASYANARRFLSAGNIPPQESVRIEEFINYFDYSYPDQSEKPFSLTYEIAPAPLEKDRLFLQLGIKARAGRTESKPWNLVFLIDTSGSMSPPERLELIKKGLHVLVGKMKPEDKVSIVTYAGNAGIALDATTAKDSARILAAIDALGSGGSTNGAGGIQVAYEVAQRNFITGGVNRVVLATDGDFNVGITSNDELVRIIEEKRKSGITLTTLGVGTDNFKDSRLEQLADKGNGNYFYLDSFQEARHVLGDKIAGTVEVVAKDVKLQIEFNPQHVAQYRLIGYDNRKLNKEDFNNDAIDAGEIGVGHTVTAIYEVILTDTELAKRLNTEYRYQQAPTEPTPTPRQEFSPELAFLKIRYKEPDGAQSQLLEFPLEAARVKQNVDSASKDFKFASAVAYFGTILRGSKFVGSYSLSDVIQLAEQAVGDDPSGHRREFVNLVKNAEARIGKPLSYGGYSGNTEGPGS